MLYVDSRKQIVKHYCQSGETQVIGELPREVLDGTVELFQRADGENGAADGTIGIAITSGQTLGGCRVIVYEIPFSPAAIKAAALNAASAAQATATMVAARSSGSGAKNNNNNKNNSNNNNLDHIVATFKPRAQLIAQFVGHVAPIVGLDFLPSAIVSAGQDRQFIM